MFSYIDEVLLTMHAKNASEILDDATLVTHHSFDTPGSYHDDGSLKLIAIYSNITSVAGRINRAITFSSNLSYYQVRFIYII